MLTARGLVEQRVEGLDAGAGRLSHQAIVWAELPGGVRALVSPEASIAQPQSFARQTFMLDRHRRRATRDKETIPLTSREFALLELLLLRAPELIPQRNPWNMFGTATRHETKSR